ncbi:hypothetical protein [Paraglaciecola sp. 2405UD69-4]|uniref:hypothetical protein n=1 Tax=Paraglaciecola sp. 2405UD69-4 TaxID=3391836 RepID=UPI0039C8CD91
MVRIITVTLFIILSGCASTQNEKLTSKRVGVLTPEAHNNQFCYLYKGVTVFNNEFESENLVPNFSESYSEYVNKGITKSGNVPIHLGKLPANKISHYFERKEWDHSITLTQEGRSYIEAQLKTHQVDYILLPWLYSLDRCMVSVEVGYSDLDYALNSNVQLHLLNAQTLQHMQSRQVNSINSARSVYLPENKATPTPIDKTKLSEKLYVELEDDVFRLLDGDCCYSKRDDLP